MIRPLLPFYLNSRVRGDGNVDRSHDYKEEKYAPLVADLSRSYRTYHFSIEISVRGQVTGANKSRLKAFVYRVCS